MLKNAPVKASVPATDIERAKAFYADKLGLVPSIEDAGGMLFEFPPLPAHEGAGTGLVVHKARATSSGDHTQVNFQVADVAAEVVELKGRGVVFEEYDTPGFKTVDGIADLPNGARTAYFKDSEGNLIALVQRPT